MKIWQKSKCQQQQNLVFSFWFKFIQQIENINAKSFGPHCGFTCDHDLLKHPELCGIFETDKIHASFTAEITPIEPIPVLEFVPRFTPR